jgi:hypothetical protein
MSITLTAQDMVILRKMASLSSSGWQPAERDVAVVGSLIERGVLETRPGFSSVQWTEAGRDAWMDVIEREAERAEREGR